MYSPLFSLINASQLLFFYHVYEYCVAKLYIIELDKYLSQLVIY